MSMDVRLITASITFDFLARVGRRDFPLFDPNEEMSEEHVLRGHLLDKTAYSEKV